jgi:hypothetical protein
MIEGGDIWAWCVGDRTGLAMASPEAAMALARPVGLRALDRRQGRLLLLLLILAVSVL